jgi:hypothetical protein
MTNPKTPTTKTPAKTPAKRATRRDKGRPKRQSAAELKAKPDAVSGAKKGLAARMMRDSRIVQRVLQQWSWEAIAVEAGLSVAGAKKAYAGRRELAPMALQIDPVQVIEGIAEGYQLSIGDLEALAVDAVNRNQLGVAVGAKKAANEARGRMIDLLQATGRLPQDLAALRHLIDLRSIAVRMLDTIDGFEREMALVPQIEDAEARAAATADTVSKVRTTFADLLGIDAEAPQITA